MARYYQVTDAAETYTVVECDDDPWCVLSPHPDSPDWHMDATGYTYEVTEADRQRYIYGDDGKPVGKVY